MFEHLDDVDPPRPGPRERARVFNRADQLVHHRRIVAGLCIAVVVALVAAIPGVLTAAGGGSKKLRTAAAPATTSSTDEFTPGVVSPAGDETVPGSSTTTTTSPAQLSGSSAARPSATTTPAKGASGSPSLQPSGGQSSFTSSATCRNSSDPKCGPFYWDPPPADDQPATMTITWSPAQPKVGEKVTFRVVVNDPDDASPLYNIKSWDYGEGGGQMMVGEPTSQDPCAGRYGPWTPPQAAPGQYQEEGGFGLEYTFKESGPHTVRFSYVPQYPQCVDPYASGANAAVTVDVS